MGEIIVITPVNDTKILRMVQKRVRLNSLKEVLTFALNFLLHLEKVQSLKSR